MLIESETLRFIGFFHIIKWSSFLKINLLNTGESLVFKMAKVVLTSIHTFPKLQSRSMNASPNWMIWEGNMAKWSTSFWSIFSDIPEKGMEIVATLLSKDYLSAQPLFIQACHHLRGPYIHFRCDISHLLAKFRYLVEVESCHG